LGVKSLFFIKVPPHSVWTNYRAEGLTWAFFFQRGCFFFAATHYEGKTIKYIFFHHSNGRIPSGFDLSGHLVFKPFFDF